MELYLLLVKGEYILLKNKLTSSINYGLAYDLWFLIDKDLQEIYNLKKSKIYTDNIDDIFENFLKIFAQKKN